jgi:hypothetical protein
VAESASTAAFLAEQQRRNRATQGHWQLFASHRQRVTDLLVSAAQAFAPHQPRLCVLGAGNANDFDLPQLLARFGQIHLVDWDGEALAAGVDRQGLADNTAIVCHGGANLAAPFLPKTIGGPVEVVASTCLLSQLIEGVAKLAGEGSPQHLDLVQAVRLAHLQTMAELLVTKGIGILITDLVSSDTVPQLVTAQEVEIAPLVARCIAERNFFTGLNPAVLLELFVSDPLLRSRTDQIQPLSPWRWNLGSRVYAVYGIRFRHT